MFKKARVRTNSKNRCISVKGVNLGNSSDGELRLYRSLCTFQKKVKNNVREIQKSGISIFFVY